MQRFFKIFILLFGLSLFGKEAKAQEFVADYKAITTNVENGRFELMNSPTEYGQIYLLDKYSGRVWIMRNDEFEEISVEGIADVKADKINFQLYIYKLNYLFLLNIHTGETWKYVAYPKQRKFSKLNSPMVTNKDIN
mgnify:CR=1 FL=1